MTPEQTIDLFQQAGFIIVKVILVVILPGLIVGLLVSVFQAATQINEQTLSFLPRLIVTLFVLMLTAPWLLSIIQDFTLQLMSDIPLLIG